MKDSRILYKNLWRDGTVIARSSQNPQFPAESTQDDDTALTWRSRSGAGTGNGLFRLFTTLGSSILTGGDCESAAPFTPISGASLDVWADGEAGNCLRMTTSADANRYFYQNVNLVAGQWYYVSGYAKSGTSGAVTVDLKIGSNVAIGSITTDGTWKLISYFFLAMTTGTVQFRCNQQTAAAGTVFFDTLNVRPVSAGNRLICFDEGGEKLVANLTTGDYNGQTLAAHIAAVLSAVGGDYTCTYSELTGKFTIARPAGNFTLYFADSGTTSDALGFNAETKTGAATYTADNRRIHTEEFIDLDVGAAAEVDFVALLNHNITAAAGTAITLFGADDAAFTTNLTTDVLAYNAANGYWILPAPRTKRYYRIHIVNRPNSNLYISIGTIVLGKSRDLGGPFRRGWGRGYVNDSASEETPSRNLFLTQARPAVRSWSCSWTNLSDTAVEYIEEAVRECGGLYCLIVCTNASDPMNNSFWFRMVDPPLAENISANRWSWTCDFIGQP